jgi:hypothetical protein
MYCKCLHCSKNVVFWDVTPCGCCIIPEDGILHSYRRESHKSYIQIAFLIIIILVLVSYLYKWLHNYSL